MIKNNQPVLLSVKIITKAKVNKIVGWKGGFLKVQLTSAPVKGQANERLIGLLSDFSILSKNKITIIRGFTTNKKLISLPAGQLGKIKTKFM